MPLIALTCHAIQMPVKMMLCNAHAKDIMPCQCEDTMTCQCQDVIPIQCQNRENHAMWCWGSHAMWCWGGYHTMPIQGYYVDDSMPCQCQAEDVMPRTSCHANGYHVKSMPSQGCHAITNWQYREPFTTCLDTLTVKTKLKIIWSCLQKMLELGPDPDLNEEASLSLLVNKFCKKGRSFEWKLPIYQVLAKLWQ